jgi:VanZ family protein
MLEPLARRLGAPWPKALLVWGFWLLVVIISWLAVAPESGQPSLGVSDKVTHSTAFLVLMLALCAAYFPNAGTEWRAAFLPALILLGYGIGIEVVQAFLPHRHAEVRDVVSDALGIGLGALLYRWPGAYLAQLWFDVHGGRNAVTAGSQR